MKHRQLMRALSGALVILAGMILPSAACAAVMGESLKQKLAAVTDADVVGVVIVAFDTDTGLRDEHLQLLSGQGITGGRTLPTLGMVAIPGITAGQVRAIAAHPAVRSVWANDPITYHMHQARVLTGVERLQADSVLTTANGGLPVFGVGDFSVVINDSGIDATHEDLKFGDHVIQNVQIVTDEATGTNADTSLYGFTPLVFVEDVPNTDTHIGHGTHCAGIAGGNGVRSGGLYRGVAPGAKLIGLGSGAVQYILAALGGFEWSLANQPRYRIRVISNSWGSSGPFVPEDPINLASKLAHSRNIVVVFAAGNDGPAPDTHNPYAKAPWVISVAAGSKEGGLADFSSRGIPREQRLADADPLNDFDAPTLTAPGSGRQFESNADKFTAAIVSTRSNPNLVANGLGDDTEIPLAYAPYYTQIVGTSMACPHVAGTVALMLDANPALTPDQVKQILVDTATAMPGFAEWEVGAGYLNAQAAVDKAFNAAAPYASLAKTEWRATVTPTKLPTETHVVHYSPTVEGKASTNAVPFVVADDTDILEVVIEYGNTDLTLFGNILILRLYAPNGMTFSNAGSVLFPIDAPRRYVKVVSPMAGQWYAEVRGARGLAAFPQATSPVALALPDRVDVFIDRTQLDLGPVTDIADSPYAGEIEHALKFRYVDLYKDGSFKPTRTVTRGDFSDALRINAPVRQAVRAPEFTDVSTELQPLAQAVTQDGAGLRHFDFEDDGFLAALGSQFKPSTSLSRLELAVALVRALGQEDDAQALAGSTVTVTNSAGETVVLADLLEIPAEYRGHVQIALNKSFLDAKFSELGAASFNPGGTLTRAELAAALNSYRDAFGLE